MTRTEPTRTGVAKSAEKGSGPGGRKPPALSMRRDPPLWAVVTAITWDVALDFALFYGLRKGGRDGR